MAHTMTTTTITMTNNYGFCSNSSLPPVLSKENMHFLQARGRLYSSCVRSSMLHGSVCCVCMRACMRVHVQAGHLPLTQPTVSEH